MIELAPWAYGPFELLLHAELHLRAGADFDRRMAMISFDNAIEVTITAYLSLNPINRQNRDYPGVQVAQWTRNYHTKLEFFESECNNRGLAMLVQRAHIVWYHDIRNEQYHSGKSTLPDDRALKGIRKAAHWIFSVLYDVPNVDIVLEEHIAAMTSAPIVPEREDRLDRQIDHHCGLIELGGEPYYASDLLYGYDPNAYRDLGLRLLSTPDGEEGDD